MEININDEHSILEIKENFKQWFPFLKIEFLEHPIGNGLPIKSDNTLAQYRKDGSTTDKIVITAKQKVSELKQLFFKVYGLIIQVFRKIGKIWLETTSTSDWTIGKQNDEALIMSTLH